MATASSLLPQEKFVCSVCLEVFTEPVSTPCGHNFCFACINKYWDNGGLCQCPVCRHQFPTRPELKVNTVISELVGEYKKSFQLKTSTPDQHLPETADVLCDVCTETKVSALKSCLMCLSSFCEVHLEPHLRVAGLRSHTLIEPVQSFDDKLCTKHNKITELYCRTDQLCICMLCDKSEHQSHDVVPLEEEYAAVMAKKDDALASIQEMIQTRSEKITEIETSVSVSQTEADKEKEAAVQVFTDLIQCVQRNQAEVIEVIEERHRATKQKGEGFIRELRQEITELQRRHAELEKLSQSADQHRFLQNFSTLSSPLNNDVASVVVNGSLSFQAVREALCELQRSVDEKVEEIVEIILKKMRKHAVDVTFDPDTASPSLVISQDGKHVTSVDEEQDLPNNPKRFEVWAEVLAKEGFTTGKFYYEVKVTESGWAVGAARESVERKKKTRFSVEEGFWCIGLFDDTYRASDETKTELTLKKKIQNVGIFVDYQEGKVSFWDVDSKSHIYTFSSQNFTEMIYPYFYNNTDNETLSITPVHPETEFH